jgi:D-psicose/D-tagatose/L-ribulose 3-epimerase
MMFDTFHANIEEKSVAQAVAFVAESLAHVHISENDRGTPGRGHVPWDETFAALRRAAYDGWLVIEAFGAPLSTIAATARVWRDLSPSAEEVYTRGLRLMKEKWAAAPTRPASALDPTESGR